MFGALATLEPLRERYCTQWVHFDSGPLLTVISDITPEVLARHGAVVVTNSVPLKQLVEWNNFTHNRKLKKEDGTEQGMFLPYTAHHRVAAPILFLYADTNGVTATMFADFGPQHDVKDASGEPPIVNPIDLIEVGQNEGEEPHLVIRVTRDKHDLGMRIVLLLTNNVDDDQVVSFTDVEGIPDLNGASFPIKRIYKKMTSKKTVTVDGETKEITEIRSILVPNRVRIDIPDAKKWENAYKSGGLMTEERPTTTLEFRPLAESVTHPATSSDALDVMKLPDEIKVLVHPNEVKVNISQASLPTNDLDVVWRCRPTPLLPLGSVGVPEP